VAVITGVGITGMGITAVGMADGLATVDRTDIRVADIPVAVVATVITDRPSMFTAKSSARMGG
jgi:hypothetical protein